MGLVELGVVAEVTAKAGTKDVISIRIKRMKFTMCQWWRSKQQWPRWLRFHRVDWIWTRYTDYSGQRGAHGRGVATTRAAPAVLEEDLGENGEVANVPLLGGRP